MSCYSRAETTASSFADADWDLIERIVGAVPEGETGFQEVSAAYDRIMEESGLDPQDDPTHFRLLLKIHAMRAPTLRARLEKWRSGNRSTSAGTEGGFAMGEVEVTHEVKSLELSYDQRPFKRRDPLDRLDTHNVRKKIPFLAEVGSDPDEGDGDDELNQAGLTDLEAETTVDYQEDSSSVSDIASTEEFAAYTTPRSNGIPAYYAGPIGTVRYNSKPIEQDVKTARPKVNPYETPLRPIQHFHRNDSTAQADRISDLPLTPPTPPIRAHHSARGSIDALLEDEAFEMERLHEVELGRAEEFRKMQREADEFYSFGLKSRVMREWLGELEWERNDLNELIVDLGQAKLSRALHHWRAGKAMHDRLGDLAARTHRRATQGEAFRRWAMRAKQSRIQRNCDRLVERQEMELVGHAWRDWRELLDRRAKRKWQDEMMEKELVVREKEEFRVVTGCFAKWRTARNVRRANRHKDEVVLLHVVEHWRSRASQSAALRAKEDLLSKSWEQRVTRGVLQDWRRDTQLRLAEADVLDMVDDRIEAEAWKIWKSRFGDERAASNLSRTRLLKSTYAIWSDKMGRVKLMAQTSFKIQREKEAAVVSTAFRFWRNTARSHELERKHTAGAMRLAMATWVERLHAQRLCEVKAEKFDEARQTVTLKACLRHWRQKQAQLSLLSQAANLHNKQCLLQKTFTSWNSSLKSGSNAAVRADVLRVFFLERRGLTTWIQRCRQRKRDAWVDAKRLETVKECFGVWRNAKEREKDLKIREAKLQHQSDKRIALFTLNSWLKRVVEHKSAEYEVKVKYDGKLARIAFSSWTNAVLKQGEALSLSQSFRDVREEATRRRLFSFWLASARESKSQRLMLESFRKEQQVAEVRASFDHWRWKVRQAQLRPVESEVTLRREDALLFAAFENWKSKSRRLPAIAFERSITKRKAWDAWVRALPKAKMLRETAQRENRVVIEQFFNHWKVRYRSKVARRASARHRGSSNLLRLRPSLDVVGVSDTASLPSPISNVFHENRRSSRRRSGLFAPAGTGSSSVC